MRRIKKTSLEYENDKDKEYENAKESQARI